MQTMVLLSNLIKMPEVSKDLKNQIEKTFGKENLDKIYYSMVRLGYNQKEHTKKFFIKNKYGDFQRLEDVFKHENNLVKFIMDFKKDIK